MSEKSQRRWTDVVDAAALIFHDKGYEATTVQEVADSVGILKGSLYHYIKTKQDLLFAVAEQANAASLNTLEQVRALNVDTAAELAAFIRAHLELLLREGIKFRAYLRDVRSLDEKQYAVVAEHRRQYARYVEELIARGQREGVFKSTVDPHLLALGLLGMLNWTNEWYRADGPNAPQDIFRAFTETGLRTVGAKESAIARLSRGDAASGLPKAAES